MTTISSTPAAPPRISVVIPVLNAERFLQDALSSVRSQDVGPVELIVVDDGSEDDSVHIARRYADVLLQTPGRQGPSFSRNMGAAAASGELLAFLDADDVWLTEHLRIAATALSQAPEADVFFSQVRAFGADDYVTGAGTGVPAWMAFDARIPLIGRNIVTQITVVLRRRSFDLVGGYDIRLRFAEDYDLWHRLAARGAFVHVPRVTARYRVHQAQASNAKEMLHRSGWEVRARHFAALCNSDSAAAARAAGVLADAWRSEAKWTVRMGDRELHALFASMYPEVAHVLAVHGFQPPDQVPWSALSAEWHRFKRGVRALVAPGRAG